MRWYAPLFNYWSNCENFYITNYLSIEKDAYSLSKELTDFLLSGSDVSEINSCGYWVIVKESKSKYLSVPNVLNTLLISFWVLTPNQLHYRFRFSERKGDMRRYLDRFIFNSEDENQNTVDELQLTKVKQFYRSLARINKNKDRLQTALLYTYRGCVAYDWRVSFVLFTAALEAILTYKRGYGMTRRHAEAYSILTETTSSKRDLAAKRFERLYNIRSDIMHGNKIKSRATTNFKNLSKLSHLLRRLWNVILCDNQIISSLELNDQGRELFFRQLGSS